MNFVRLTALGGLVGASLLFPVSAFAATFSLSPATETLNRGCNYSLKIELDSSGVKVDGADALLTYEPNKLSTSLSLITTGSLFADFPGTTVDDKKGSIRISGIGASDTAEAKKGTFATINFKVKADAPLGSTNVNFDFDPKAPTKTVDSNILETKTAKDILTGVTNGAYQIGSGSCGDGTEATLTASSASPTASAKPAVLGASTTSTGGSLPDSGLGTPTLVIGAIGILLLLFGFFGLFL